MKGLMCLKQLMIIMFYYELHEKGKVIDDFNKMYTLRYPRDDLCVKGASQLSRNSSYKTCFKIEVFINT